MGANSKKTPITIGIVPVSALSAECRIESILSKIRNTPEGGNLQGIIEPIWSKTMESELRLSWLKEMIERKLVVRDIESFGRNTTQKFRSESSRSEELGREALIELMRVKLADERRYYRECKKIREKVRDIVREKIGRRAYDKLMRKLKDKVDFHKRELKKKYVAKTELLSRNREEEILTKLEEVPLGLESFSGSKVFSRGEMEEMKPEKQRVDLIGEVQIDEDERSILELNPKFAVLKKICIEDMEQDIEICNAKLRYERRRSEEILREREIYESEYGEVR